MALKEYYELSVMLRIQLPILMSFAVLKCLMGAVANFWGRKFLPRSLQVAVQPIGEATEVTLSCMYGVLLGASVAFGLVYYQHWNPRWNDQPLMCAEFASHRVQAFACATGLLALFTSGEPLALALALSTFKAVADGSVVAVLLLAFTWRAAMMTHKTAPVRFFGALLVCNSAYSIVCYTDDYATNRAGGAILASCFGCLMIIYYTIKWLCRTLWAKLCMYGKVTLRSIHLLKTPGPELPEPTEDTEQHPHSD